MRIGADGGMLFFGPRARLHQKASAGHRRFHLGTNGRGAGGAPRRMTTSLLDKVQLCQGTPRRALQRAYCRNRRVLLKNISSPMATYRHRLDLRIQGSSPCPRRPPASHRSWHPSPRQTQLRERFTVPNVIYRSIPTPSRRSSTSFCMR